MSNYWQGSLLSYYWRRLRGRCVRCGGHMGTHVAAIEKHARYLRVCQTCYNVYRFLGLV